MVTRAFARQAPTVLGTLSALTALSLVLPFGMLAWALSPKSRATASVSTIHHPPPAPDLPAQQSRPALRLVVSNDDR